jgi:hypothetical protein
MLSTYYGISITNLWSPVLKKVLHNTRIHFHKFGNLKQFPCKQKLNTGLKLVMVHLYNCPTWNNKQPKHKYQTSNIQPNSKYIHVTNYTNRELLIAILSCCNTLELISNSVMLFLMYLQYLWCIHSYSKMVCLKLQSMVCMTVTTWTLSENRDRTLCMCDPIKTELWWINNYLEGHFYFYVFIDPLHISY